MVQIPCVKVARNVPRIKWTGNTFAAIMLIRIWINNIVMVWPMERSAKVMPCVVLDFAMEEGYSRPEDAGQCIQKDRDVTANQMMNVMVAHVTALPKMEITSAVVRQTDVISGTVDA